MDLLGWQDALPIAEVHVDRRTRAHAGEVVTADLRGGVGGHDIASVRDRCPYIIGRARAWPLDLAATGVVLRLGPPGALFKSMHGMSLRDVDRIPGDLLCPTKGGLALQGYWYVTDRRTCTQRLDDSRRVDCLSGCDCDGRDR